MASSSGNSDRWIHRSGSLDSVGVAFANSMHRCLIILHSMSRVTVLWTLRYVASQYAGNHHDTSFTLVC